MKCTAIATVLALAIPAAVYAQPPVPDREAPRTYDRDYDHDRDRDWFRHEHYDRYGSSHWAEDVHGRWVTLARANSAAGRREFLVGTGNRYHTFRIEGLRGDPAIHRIAINFANGTTQVVQMNTALPAGAGEVIDLQGNERRVSRIVVYADPHSRGVYAIYGT
jgi:hypothetical protein